MKWRKTFSQNYYRLSFSIRVMHDRLLPSTPNPRFSQDFFKVRTTQKSHPCSCIIWIVTLDVSEDGLRDDSDYYFIGEYLVRHWSKNRWLNKINIILSFWWSNYRRTPTKRSAMGLKKIFRKEYVILGLRVTVIHLALAIGFAISGHVLKSYRVYFFSLRTENRSHTNER